MPSWDSLAAFGKELAGFDRDLTVNETRKITRAQGVAAQAIAAKQAAQDLGGDRAFSGWNRGQPIPLDTRLRSLADGNALMTPRFAGGWTVAERGRHQGDAGGFAGPGINRVTGVTSRTKAGRVRKVRARQSKRWNGATRGKGTASDAIKVMDRELPKIADAAVLKVTRKRFDVT